MQFRSSGRRSVEVQQLEQHTVRRDFDDLGNPHQATEHTDSQAVSRLDAQHLAQMSQTLFRAQAAGLVVTGGRAQQHGRRARDAEGFTARELVRVEQQVIQSVVTASSSTAPAARRRAASVVVS